MAETKKIEVVTPEQIAAEQHVPVKTIQQWLRLGKMRGYKFGELWRTTTDAVEEFKKHNKPLIQQARAAARRRVPGPSRQRGAAAVCDAAGVGP